ncbi:MAG: translation initiation factor IF-2 [Acidobacteria bacterium]|nr:translation initiation factor IF-2 [Acidobacteriota bacterium]
MATVRIYKVAELLNTTSQEVLDLLKKNHGIELKSASSTLEEIVARQFVERLARQRGIELPKGDIFSDQAVKAAKSKAAGSKKAGAAVEPPKPAVPTLGPPRLVKKPTLVKPAAAAPEAPAAMEAPAPEAVEPPAPVPVEAVAAEPPVEIEVPPPAAAAPAPVAIEEAPEPPVEPAPPVAEPAAATAEPVAKPAAPPAPPAPPAAPARPAGRFVPPSIRLRVEEPGQAPPQAPPLVPKRAIVPPQPPRPTPTPRPTPPPQPARPGGPRPPYGSRPAGGMTPAMLGGPRPLPSQPVRPGQPPPGRPGMPGGPRPPYGQQFRPRPGGGPRPAQRRDALQRMPSAAAPVAPPPISRTITLAEGMTVKDLADKLDVRVKEVLKALLDRRMMMTINSVVDMNTARDVARGFGADIETRTYEEELLETESEAVDPKDLLPRAPVVTVMGHVDHGKTTLLDSIRETRVAEREAGGITQHIGAYLVTGVGEKSDKSIVFLDTPGHAAFTLMRARGAKITDVVILVVAADDGVMPQTKEAIDHAKAAGVPIIVAVNKIDKPGANPEVPKRQLADLGLMPEDWGGDTVFVEVSAKQKKNLETLLEMILLVTDIGEHKANPKRAAVGTVLETKLDRGRGPVATVLVQDGTLRVGDNVIAGPVVGRVRALIDDRGRSLKQAGPSTPVEVLGLEALPSPGEPFQAVADPAKARQIATFRQAQAKERALGAKGSRLTLESLQQQLSEEGMKELAIIIKADVQGSAEVLADSLSKLSDEKTKVKIIHSAVGAINESDVLLAAASNAIIIGFNVRPDRNAAEVAEREKVDIRHHSVIYNVTEEIQKAMTGLLEPTIKEVRLGSAQVRDTFKVPKVGVIAGCMVSDGRITRQGDAQARLLRDNVVIWEGRLASLKRFKDDVSEVKAGFECGIGLQNFNDIKVGDVIEVFQMERVAATA